MYLCFVYRKDKLQAEALQVLEEAGIDFNRNRDEGIVHQDFCRLFYKSNLVKNDKVSWIAFNARYDYGYLLSMYDQ